MSQYLRKQDISLQALVGCYVIYDGVLWRIETMDDAIHLIEPTALEGLLLAEAMKTRREQEEP